MDPIPQFRSVPQQTIAPASVQNPQDGSVRLPVLRINPISVTRDLPPSVTAPGALGDARRSNAATAVRPVIEVPSYELDYPVIDAPTQEEFDAAVKKGGADQQKKDSGDEAAKARELSNKLPVNGVLQQILNRPPNLFQVTPRLPETLQGAPVATPAPPPKAETAAASVTLPFIGTMPLPSKEAMAVATTTAVAATFVAVLGKAALEASLEGIRPALRLLLIRWKKVRNRDLSHEELQLEFAFELEKKHKGKRTFRQAMSDLKDYFKDNFLEDLIGN